MVVKMSVEMYELIFYGAIALLFIALSLKKLIQKKKEREIERLK